MKDVRVKIGEFQGQDVLFARHSWGNDTTIKIGKYVLPLSYVDSPKPGGGRQLHRLKIKTALFPETMEFYQAHKKTLDEFVGNGDLRQWIDMWAAAQPSEEDTPKTNNEPPPRLPGQTDEEYYDSDAYYNWKHR